MWLTLGSTRPSFAEPGFGVLSTDTVTTQNFASRWRPLIALRRAVAVAVAVSFAVACAPPRGERIVLITLDTLRADSFLGSAERPSSMPLTLALASQGAIFDRFHATASSTQPSHASMFTGLHPWQHGVTRNGQILTDDAETVAETLTASGWQTAAVVASFPVASRFGFAQGFASYDDTFDLPYLIPAWEGQAIPDQRFHSTAPTVTDKAIALLDRLTGQNQLLWFHYFDAHSPYGDSAGLDPLRMGHVKRAIRHQQPVESILHAAREGYEADVAVMDRQLSRLLARLDADADRFETHLVVVSDHGESFGEGGALAHGKRLTPEQIRVPLFILSPRIEPGRQQRIAGSVDVAATLLDLAGLPSRGPGQSLLTAPQRPPTAVGMRRTFAGEATELRLDGTLVPIVGHRFFAVGREGLPILGNARELLPPPASSPALSAAERNRMLALFAHFEQQLSSTHNPSATDDESRRALRALGYVD